MRRLWVVVFLILFLPAGVYGPRTVNAVGTHSLSVDAPTSNNAYQVLAKKKCKKGYKRVHGKCKKKNAPAPQPTPVPQQHFYYVAIGDSLTYGFGADDPETQSFPALLARYLPNGEHVLNLGAPGFTTLQARVGELPRALAVQPKIATVWLGTNDVHEGVDTAAFASDLERILSALQSEHVQVFVATLPDFQVVPLTAGGNPDYSIPGRADNAAIVAVAARYGDAVIDVYSASKSLWGRPDFVYSDGIHLTTAGYAALADMFYSVMHKQGGI